MCHYMENLTPSEKSKTSTVRSGNDIVDSSSSSQKQDSPNSITTESSTSKKESLPLQKKYAITQEISKGLGAKYGKIFIPSDKTLQIKKKEPEDKFGATLVIPEKVILTKPGYISPKEVKAAKEMFVENMRDLIQCRKKTFSKSTEEKSQDEKQYSANEYSSSDPSNNEFIVESVDPFTYNVRLSSDNQTNETTNTLNLNLTKEFENQELISGNVRDNVNDSLPNNIQNKIKRKTKAKNIQATQNKFYEIERERNRVNYNAHIPLQYPTGQIEPPTIFSSGPPVFPHNNNLNRTAGGYPDPNRHHQFQTPACYINTPPFAHPNNYFEYQNEYSSELKPPYLGRTWNQLDYSFHPYFGRNISHPRYPIWPHSCGYQNVDYRTLFHPQEHIRPPPVPWFGLAPRPMERHHHYPPYPQFPARTYYEL